MRVFWGAGADDLWFGSEMPSSDVLHRVKFRIDKRLTVQVLIRRFGSLWFVREDFCSARATLSSLFDGYVWYSI